MRRGVDKWMSSILQRVSGFVEALNEEERSGSVGRAFSAARLREFTEEELRAYDGSDPKKPILMAIKGQIYDVSQTRMFYGPGGPYSCFAGKDVSRALAKMSLKEDDLIGDISGLGPFELESLAGWECKFMSRHAMVGTLKKAEPVAVANVSETTEKSTCMTGRVCIDSKAMVEVSSCEVEGSGSVDRAFSAAQPREFTEEELRAYDGSNPNKPLLMAIKGQIYDVSESRMFYGPGGPYGCFAGKDASRALAKMSFEEDDLIGDISGLGPFELETLSDWEFKFMSKYAKVGTLKKAEPVAVANVSETTEKSACMTERGRVESKATAEASSCTTESGRIESKGKHIADDDAENKHIADAEHKNVTVQKKVAVRDRNRRVSFTADIVYRLVPPTQHLASKIN